MTLAEIRTLHAYNSWADNLVFEALSEMPGEQYMKDLRTSHGGIHGTMVHLVGAEKIWLERFHGAPKALLSENPPKSLAELRSVWEQVGYDTAKWIGSMTDRKLGETFTMTTLSGQTYTHIFWQAYQHLVNHSSYHRGQVVAMMRQLGAKPPVTDLIRFYRETGAGKSR
jgi:uncharacterized damage-inducible protein DinB